MREIFVYIFVVVVVCLLDSEGVRVLEDYPCNGSTKILETFNETDPSFYTLVIIPSEFSEFPVKVDIRLQFDSYVNITMNFQWLSLYDDSLTVQAVILNENKANMSMTVQPRWGKPFPNLLGANINMRDVCKDGVHKGVWDKYRILEPPIQSTQPPDVTTYHPIWPSPASPNPTDPNSNGACGLRRVQHEGLIVSGVGARPGDWPWHVAVYRLTSSIASLVYTCGGSLVTKTRVLTAGHCAVENGAVLIPERMFVSLGKYNYVGGDPSLQEKPVYEILLHPDFKWRTLSNDISLLKLSSEAVFSDFVQPICLWSHSDTRRSSIVGKYGYVVGWGATRRSKFSYQLKEAVMPVRSDLECIRNEPTFFSRYLTDFTLCAGFANGTGACNGDSGGGLFFPSRNLEGTNVWHLRGVISLGVSQRDQNRCDPHYYTIFTDIAKYLDFIYLNI